MSKFKETLTKDAGWKLLSLLIAICLWFVIINIENPVEYRVFTSNVAVSNISYAEEAGKTVTNVDEIESTRISVRLRGKRIVLDKIQQNKSFAAYVDISSIDMDTAGRSVILPIKLKTGLPSSDYVDTEFLSVSEIEVLLDDNVSESFEITAVLNGVPEGGLSVNAAVVDPEYVKVYGAQSAVSQVKYIKAVADLDSPFDGQQVTASLVACDAAGNAVSGVYLSRDTALITIKIESSRKVPVQISTKGEPAKGCSVGNITLTPDFVQLSGNPEIINNLVYITLPEIDIEGASSDVTETINAALSLPDGVEIAAGFSGEITVTVEITGEKEHLVTFDSDDIVINGTAENNETVRIEKDSFNIDVSGSGFDESKAVYSIDAGGLSAGEHRVKVNIELPEGCTLIGSSPYVTVIVGEEDNTENTDTNS